MYTLLIPEAVSMAGRCSVASCVKLLPMKRMLSCCGLEGNSGLYVEYISLGSIRVWSVKQIYRCLRALMMHCRDCPAFMLSDVPSMESIPDVDVETCGAECVMLDGAAMLSVVPLAVQLPLLAIVRYGVLSLSTVKLCWDAHLSLNSFVVALKLRQ